MYIFNFQELPLEVDFPNMIFFSFISKINIIEDCQNKKVLLLLLLLLLLLFTLTLRFIRKFAYTGLAKLPGFDSTFEYASSN